MRGCAPDFRDKANFFQRHFKKQFFLKHPAWTVEDAPGPRWSRKIRVARGGWETFEAPPSPAHPRQRPRSAAEISAVLQVPAQQLELERGRAGRRLRVPRGARPPRPHRPLPAPRGLGPHSAPPARPRAPWIPARGGRGLTAAPALAPGPRALLPPPGRMAAASEQRRFLAPALTVRWGV